MEDSIFKKELLSFLKDTLQIDENDLSKCVSSFNNFDLENYLEALLKDVDLDKFPKYIIPKVHKKFPFNNDFQAINSIKRCFIDNFINHFYKDIDIPNVKITLFTWVMPDGMGDLYCQEKTYKLLDERFKNIDISQIFLVEKNVKLPKFLKNTLIHRYEWNNKIEKQKFSDDIDKTLNSSDIIFQLPTYYPYLDEFNSLKIALGEYGFIISKDFSPMSKNYSLGLGYLEKGIIIDKEIKKDFSKLNKSSHEKLDIKDIDEYEKNNHLFLSYLLNEKSNLLYFQILLKYLEEDKKDIDICVSNFSLFINSLKNESFSSFLKKYNVKDFIVLVDGEKFEKNINSSGKTIRIISIQGLSNTDFINLLSCSYDFVGCRGNYSLTEAISQNKVFFYDGASHTKRFFQDLLAIAENRIKDKFPKSYQFLKLLSSMYDEDYDIEILSDKLSRLLKDEKTITGMKYLNKILQNENRANENICNMIARVTYLLNNPSIQQKESEIIENYILGKIGFPTMMYRIKNLLYPLKDKYERTKF